MQDKALSLRKQETQLRGYCSSLGKRILAYIQVTAGGDESCEYIFKGGEDSMQTGSLAGCELHWRCGPN